MKNLKFRLVIFFCMISLFSHGQQNHVNIGCGTHLSEEENSIYFEKVNQMKSRPKASLNSDAQYVIPVVFHILTDPEISQEDMKCRIDDVIRIMNEDFKGLNDDFSETDPFFDNIKTTMNIEFCAAELDPNGNQLEYPGMDWQIQAGITYGYDSRINNYAWFGRNGRYYMDVLVVSFPNADNGSTNQSGHAFLPFQNVIPSIKYNYRWIGSTCGSWSDKQFASVMTHEVGHYLGLRHVWGTGATSPCDDDDGIADTPNTSGSEGCGHGSTTSCAGGGRYNAENYMDYNTDCYSMFTQGQVDLMTGWLVDLEDAPYPRGNLWQTENLIATGCIGVAPVAEFAANVTQLIEGSTVDFSDSSLYRPETWSWTFEGGTPSSSSEQNPTVTYSTAGIYQVELTVTNVVGSNTETKVGYIEVIESGIRYCAELSHFQQGNAKLMHNAPNNQWGYAGGHNGYEDKAKAEKFSTPVLPNTSIVGLDIWFAKAHAGKANSTIDVKIWDGSDGDPGNELASKTLALNTIDVNSYTKVDFDLPVAVNNEYFAGIEGLTYGIGDTVVIWLNDDGQTSPGTAWEKWSGDNWYAFNNPVSHGLDAAFYIKVRYCSGDGPTRTISNMTKNDITIYPNPSKGLFTIDFETDDSYRVKVRNTIGQKIYEITRNGSGILTIDLSSHKNGIYFVQISNEEDMVNQKVIKH